MHHNLIKLVYQGKSLLFIAAYLDCDVQTIVSQVKQWREGQTW